MSDPFFARKRKRGGQSAGRGAPNGRSQSQSNGRRGGGRANGNGVSQREPHIVEGSIASEDDEEITDPESSDEEDAEMKDAESGSGEGSDSDEIEDADEDEEFADESAADKRRRLAQQYLDNLQSEIDTAGFDARDVDKDILAARLNEDVAEDQGRLYKNIVKAFTFTRPQRLFLSSKKMLTATDVATPDEPTFAYVVSKDRTLSKFDLATGARVRYAAGHNEKDIICVAVSNDGAFVATGSADHKINVFDANSLELLKSFTQHRGAVTGLAFRRGSHILYSCSADRTVKSWSLDALTYVETLFGHQDEISAIAALAQERCITAGSRDRTVRLWKIVDESQLIFRGGGSGGSAARPRKAVEDGSAAAPEKKKAVYLENSINCVALVDHHIFVSGSDNGSLSLWTLAKKKPVYVVPQAHGFDSLASPEHYSAEQDASKIELPPKQPRWITALATLPYADIVVSGSWNGSVKVWKVNVDESDRVDRDGTLLGGTKKQYELQPVAELRVQGVVNGLSVVEDGKDALKICVAVGKEMKNGRWFKKGSAKNGVHVLTLKRTTKRGVLAGA
ncbi:WD domain-containing protein [Myxozyma melibiosi]|uniref:WD domain-containing protein n=1 Tax=Myxozyma melibiosi TaxID=54550 RepID=A0ABR1F4B0_9ASCO